MLKLVSQGRFQKYLVKMAKRGKDMSKLDEVVTLLLKNKPLPIKYRNHKLKGNYNGYWECHIEPDWLLVYKKTAKEIIPLKTGTHSDLF